MKKKLKVYLVNLYAVINAFRCALFYGTISSPLKIKHPTKSRGLTILGNGPSLKNDLDKALSRDNQDYVGLNYFACTDFFIRVKPQWYFFMDGAFFTDSIQNRRREDILKMYEVFNNQVDWDMTIVIPSRFLKAFKSFSKLNNSHVKVLGVNTNPVKATSVVRHWLYKKNWAVPAPQNVTILAIYAGVNLGYKNVYLYGVDHTFIQGICVDEQNRLCLKWDHFYDNNAEVKPVVDTLGGHPTIASELLTVAITFRSHEELREYADQIGVRIVNCTKGSMIDSYIRESQL